MGITKGLPEGFNPQNYDVIVVGAGFAGAVCARRLAEACGDKVAIIERRDHIAGNAYDCLDDAGVLIHKYGPHIYHTQSERVHEYLSRFTEWTDYNHKVLANIHGTLMPVPFNHQSLKLAFGDEKGEHLYQKLVAAFGEDKKVPIMDLREKNDPELAEVADYVYENVFLHYTMKQWGKTPDQIDPSVMGRVPVFVGDDDRYFPKAPHQGMPTVSYTDLFEHMLDHDLISVFLDVDARDLLSLGDGHVNVCGQPYGGEVIYTGALDELFGFDLGALPYRTVDMVFETLDEDQFQPVGTVNYTVSENFTRITEFKNMTGQVVLRDQRAAEHRAVQALQGARGGHPELPRRRKARGVPLLRHGRRHGVRARAVRRSHLEPLGTNDRVPAVACASAGFWHVGTI